MSLEQSPSLVQKRALETFSVHPGGELQIPLVSAGEAPVPPPADLFVLGLVFSVMSAASRLVGQGNLQAGFLHVGMHLKTMRFCGERNSNSAGEKERGGGEMTVITVSKMTRGFPPPPFSLKVM